MGNYFELYDIKPSLQPDKALLKKQFYQLSKQYHPDRLVLADEQVRADGLKKAAQINEAYQILNDEERLLAYVLRLHSVLEEEEKYALPPAFLMEMMELNEALEDYEAQPNEERLGAMVKNALEEQLVQWDLEFAPLRMSYNNGTEDKALLLRLKDFYFRKKYLLRIQERYLTFASR